MRTFRKLSVLAVFAALSGAHAQAPKDSLRIGIQLEPPALDPTAGPAEAIRDVVYDNIFEGLTRIDEQGDVRPLLARGWTVSADAKRYEFSLQPHATFSDGTKFDCGIVKFTYDRARAPGSTNPERAFYAGITNIACPAPDRAVVTLAAPDGDFLYHLAWASSAMVAPNTAAGNAQHPVGTGPYVFSDWKRGDSITLIRNDRYWGARPAIGQVTFRFINEPLTAANALDGGMLDGYINFPAFDMLSRFQGDPKFQVLIGKSPIKLIWALNEARAPFNDLRVRQALAASIDRDAIITAYGSTSATAIGSHDTPQDKDYLDLSARTPYDAAKAETLLKEAGVAPGTVIEIALPPTEYARKVGDLLSAFVAQIGLRAKLVPMQWPQWLSQVYGQADYQTTVIAHTEPHDLDIYARPHYYFGYRDAQYDALFARYHAAIDPTERRELSHQLQTRLADTQANVFIAALPHVSIWNAHLHGVWRDEPIPLNRLADISWAP